MECVEDQDVTDEAGRGRLSLAISKHGIDERQERTDVIRFRSGAFKEWWYIVL